MGVESYILNPKLDVELLKSKVESVRDRLEIRSDGFFNVDIPQSSEGVFEQMVVIRNDLNTWVWINFIMHTMPGNEEHIASYAFRDYKLAPGTQLTLVPETSGYDNASNTDGNEIRPMVDLRMPYDNFRLRVRPRVSDADSTPIAPTSGNLKLEFVRRF